ncbi:MAG: xanthine dehydrogenase family protein molybdopterin-binding subunit [Pseudomonadota bacterium]
MSTAVPHPRALRRTEDLRLLTGTGRYTEDVRAEQPERHLVFLRSSVAHGVIRQLDVEQARRSPGVRAILTIDDLDRAGVCDPRPAGFNPEGGEGAEVSLPQPALARGYVRFVGEAVAAVVADSVSAALDAIDLMDLDIEESPAAGHLRAALAEGAAQIWPERAPGNVLGVRTRGQREGTAQAMANAAHRVEIDVVNNRVAPVTLEPRGCLAIPEGEGEQRTLTMRMGSQGVHAIQRELSVALGVDKARLRVITEEVGGGFGMRLFLQSEPVVVAFAAMALGEPVRWQATRSEGFLSDLGGRDHISHASLGLDQDLRFVALQVRTYSNVGAYTSQLGAGVAFFGSSMLTGAYDIPTAWAQTHVVVTNSAPLDAYRGAGRPEASYLIERLVDKAAAELGVAPRALRLRNFVRAEQFPYVSALGQTYDSGDYHRLLDSAWHRLEGERFEHRRQLSEARGLCRGLGLAYYVEVCAAYGKDRPAVAFREDGVIEARVGTQSTGQGHETIFTQMISEFFAVPVTRVRVVQGDTAQVASGNGTGGSRTLALGGSALALTLDAMAEAGAHVAAQLLEVSVADLVFEDGRFAVTGTDHCVSLDEVVTASFDSSQRPDEVQAGLASSEAFAPQGGTYPNGAHLCEVEVDPQTGAVQIVRYVVQDDMGRVGNALLLEGQIVGGAIQGLSQALLESVVYEDDTAQLLTGTFMDYGVLRASRSPRLDLQFDGVPSPRNPLGVKGAGEAGTIGAPAALVNAVLDALRPLGVNCLDMPLTPHRVWQAIHGASISADL